MNSTMAGGCRSLFTASQWQELEHQALIFKYMMAGIPVPPDLLLFIRKSFETMATRFYHHPSTVGYCALYGKKQDPEPGRCRRTDGKKWRCSKDAYPDSKYCERHMHRGRNRSRKPVETKTPSLPPSHSQSPSSSSTVTAVTPTVSGNGGYQSAVPFHTQRSPSSSSYGPDLTQLQMDHGPSSYSVMGAKDYRCMHVVKSEEDGPSFLTRASKLDNTWPQLSSPGRNGSAMAGSYAQQHCFFGNEKYGGGGGMTETSKQESQSLRPFFDEWPKPRDSWSELEGERSNMNSISTTQLSMSIPMTSSEFSATSSTSPNE